MDDSMAGTTLWVGSIAPEASQDDVQSLFQRVGRVESVTLHRGKASQELYAFVAMRHKDDAAEAICELNSIVVPGLSRTRRPLKVMYATGQIAESASPAPAESTPVTQAAEKIIRGHRIAEAPATNILWVGSVAVSIPEEVIRETFSQYGSVTHILVHRTKSTGYDYAFVEMADVEQAVKAQQALNGARYLPITGESALKVKFATRLDDVEESSLHQQGFEAAPSRHLWLGNLFTHPSRDSIMRVFGRFGHIHNAIAVPGKLYGFVDFIDTNAAERAMAALNATIVPELTGDRPLKIEYHSYNDSESETSCSQGPSRGQHALSNSSGRLASLAHLDINNHTPSATVPNLMMSGGTPRARTPNGINQTTFHHNGYSHIPPPESPIAHQNAISGGFGRPGEVLPVLPHLEWCAMCGARNGHGRVLRKCSACHGVSYCGEECQLDDWRQRHGAECRGLAALASLRMEPIVADVIVNALQEPDSSLARAVQGILLQNIREHKE